MPRHIKNSLLFWSLIFNKIASNANKAQNIACVLSITRLQHTHTHSYIHTHTHTHTHTKYI